VRFSMRVTLTWPARAIRLQDGGPDRIFVDDDNLELGIIRSRAGG